MICAKLFPGVRITGLGFRVRVTVGTTRVGVRVRITGLGLWLRSGLWLGLQSGLALWLGLGLQHPIRLGLCPCLLSYIAHARLAFAEPLRERISSRAGARARVRRLGLGQEIRVWGRFRVRPGVRVGNRARARG